VDVVIALMTPLLAAAVLGIAAVGAYRVMRGAAFVRLFPPLALALVLAFVLFNKVGSPQYMTWIIPPLVLGLVIDRRAWWRPAVLGLAIALLTQIVYPTIYWQLLDAQLLPALLLTLRNVLVAVLLVWSVIRVVRVPSRAHAPALAPALRS
jgi:hypothetical protein